jgi:hypothetical protein
MSSSLASILILTGLGLLNTFSNESNSNAFSFDYLSVFDGCIIDLRGAYSGSGEPPRRFISGRNEFLLADGCMDGFYVVE